MSPASKEFLFLLTPCLHLHVNLHLHFFSAPFLHLHVGLHLHFLLTPGLHFGHGHGTCLPLTFFPFPFFVLVIVLAFFLLPFFYLYSNVKTESSPERRACKILRCHLRSHQWQEFLFLLTPFLHLHVNLHLHFLPTPFLHLHVGLHIHFLLTALAFPLPSFPFLSSSSSWSLVLPFFLLRLFYLYSDVNTEACPEKGAYKIPRCHPQSHLGPHMINLAT
jgi:hypothetical protein